MSDDFVIDRDGCDPANPTCVESQEWTYGIDNTGTNFRWPSATYQIELSDGSTLTFSQSTASNGGWTPQMQEWGDNIQAAADAAGLAWFVETRFVAPPDGTSLAGGGGFAGPPSVPVGAALYDGGMRWRYVNIQICPGQPVPVAATLLAVDDPGGAAVPALPRQLVTAGAVLGPIQKFWLCPECGDTPSWFLEDGTEAEPGQVPNCWEPCGTLALTDAPPDRDCQFFFDLGCDSNESTDPAGFIQQITRRATVCNGEQIAVDYFTEDPLDPTALVDHTLVGDFVDCDTGEPVPEPPAVCDEPTIRLCPDPCVNGSTYINGRPPASNAWSWGPYTGANLVEFEAALEAAGYTVNLFGEKHQICPPFGAFGEDPEAVLDNGIGQFVPPVEPNIDPDFVPVDECALLTVGKNDDRRDNLLEGLTFGDVVECGDGEGGTSAEPVVHQVVDNNTDYTYSYNTDTLKLGGTPPFNSPDAQPFYDAVVACIEGGGVAEITFTTPDGNQGFFAADGILSNNGSSGAFSGNGDTTLTQSGKVRTASMVCVTEGSVVVRDAQLVSVCGLDGIRDLLEQIEENTSPPIDIIVLDLCDDVDGNPVNYVPVFVKYTIEQGQPVVTELFSDVALTVPYTQQGTLVDCATGEPAEEPPAPVTPSNHLIEGCLDDGAGGTVSAFTIVNQDGVPLFEPRPLTDLGFIECC